MRPHLVPPSSDDAATVGQKASDDGKAILDATIIHLMAEAEPDGRRLVGANCEQIARVDSHAGLERGSREGTDLPLRRQRQPEMQSIGIGRIGAVAEQPARHELPPGGMRLFLSMVFLGTTAETYQLTALTGVIAGLFGLMWASTRRLRSA